MRKVEEMIFIIIEFLLFFMFGVVLCDVIVIYILGCKNDIL